LLLAGDHAPLIAYESLGRDAMLSIPTPEHYLRLLYVMVLCSEGDQVSFPVEGVDRRINLDAHSSDKMDLDDEF
jgi:4,5-DOPA dioxygenase extradiol